MKRNLHRTIAFIVGALAAVSLAYAQDWYEATGKPATRSLLISSDLRTEFASIDTDIADKLPTLTGNGSKIIAVNSGGTALEALTGGVSVAQGGTGATTLTGLLQGNGTSAFTAVTDSSTVGQVLRVTGASTYAWGALDLADSDAITGDIPDANLSANVPLINAQNDFTATQQIVNTAPQLYFDESDAAVDNGRWFFGATGEDFQFLTANDAGTLNAFILQVQRTGTTVDVFKIFATSLQHNNIDIGAAAGTFTLTMDTGCTTQPSGTATYAKNGNIVSLELPLLTCTSNSTSANDENLNFPAAIRPTTDQCVLASVQDNGTNGIGSIEWEADGSVLFYTSANCSGTWTASGTKQIHANTVTYLLN